ncbi:hypothetical protein I204_00581 [Kwoniella mangroviensis CBS 8886]|nr:uncharacterized protein I203_07171 [Kwoniella mangroviensis CBS 8507]OCF63850.1 hypothetical protein I203_07171 [Kwoniella mangroviensis CBS 8507]OCF78639.1 hypothetical protein I204_00581 [Kwoniella mangroviensis CBS 8886]
MNFDPFNELGGGSALRFDEGQFFSSIQDDYCLPVASHSPETERLDYIHDVYKYHAGNIPDEVAILLSDGRPWRILDVGCGTGRWALEMIEAFPNIHITGVDLAHPPITVFPPNFSFEIHDVTKGQEYEDDVFDVVHVRDIHAGMPDYHAMLTECVRVLRPGGYLLVKEIEWVPAVLDGSDAQERFPAICAILGSFRNALSERFLDPLVGVNLESYVDNVSGLCDVHYSRHMVPMTPWSDDPILNYTGQMTRLAMAILGGTMRIMLLDHGESDPDGRYAAGIEELRDLLGQPIWYFGSVVARKEGELSDPEPDAELEGYSQEMDEEKDETGWIRDED